MLTHSTSKAPILPLSSKKLFALSPSTSLVWKKVPTTLEESSSSHKPSKVDPSPSSNSSSVDLLPSTALLKDLTTSPPKINLDLSRPKPSTATLIVEAKEVTQEASIFS